MIIITGNTPKKGLNTKKLLSIMVKLVQIFGFLPQLYLIFLFCLHTLVTWMVLDKLLSFTQGYTLNSMGYDECLESSWSIENGYVNWWLKVKVILIDLLMKVHETLINFDFELIEVHCLKSFWPNIKYLFQNVCWESNMNQSGHG